MLEHLHLQPHLDYLNDSSNELSMLDKHPLVKQLFVRYNTCPLLSAPLFSSTSLVLTKRRNKLGDKLLEKLAMLEVNQHHW